MEQGGVRFAAQDQQVSPEQSLNAIETVTGLQKRQDLNPEAEQELQQLRTALKNNIQSSRMQCHAFEPVSLPGSQPASRVASGTTTPQHRRSMAAGSGPPSAPGSPSQPAVQSPPLTPAGSQPQGVRPSSGRTPSGNKIRQAPDVMTPQRSESPQRRAQDGVSSHPKQPPRFSVGASGDSQPPSEKQSPSATPGSTAPGTPRVNSSSTDITSDPNTRSKRPSIKSADSRDSEYRFGNRDPAAGYSTSGTVSTSVPGFPNAAIPGPGGVQQEVNKRSSIFGGAKKEHEESSSKLSEKDTQSSHHSSKSNLKRFFKIGEHKHKDHHRDRQANGGSTGGTSSNDDSPNLPFADDHGLQAKYGKFGKMLGSGAGGSVRLMKRTGDGTVFAVKQFRDRHAYESEKEYNKKVTAEFCIGSTLHHGNVIETIDIVQEKGHWFEVMEYAPYDLFATVMTGKMGREEVTCTMLQVLSGVSYLHSMGLAHRDLKLDNVVINDKGIMKLIDFGSAVVFRYPFENDIVLATGVVGSDPYLAPEVYDHPRYDPRPTDIWSIAIMFCCMTLRRFPWKAPRLSDNSYRLFVSPPDPEQDKMMQSHRRSLTPSSHRNNSTASVDERRESESGDHHHRHHHHHHHSEQSDDTVTRQKTRDASEKNDVTIKGPLRLLRLLPRESRHIIGRMLDLDPTRRAEMEDILADPWIQNALVCRQEEGGVVIKAPNHTHVLQPSNSG